MPSVCVMTNPRNRSNTVTQYARESDLGRTEFGDIGEVAKHDIRLGAFSDAEEVNAAIGVALSMGSFDVQATNTLISVQNDLFDLAADLSAPVNETLDPPPVRITQEHIEWVSEAVRHYSADLSTVDGYVLPGGTLAAALLFQARIAARRAERTIYAAMDQHPEEINPLLGSYLNAVSSLLFVLARTSNDEHGDTMWRPLASVTPPPDATEVG